MVFAQSEQRSLKLLTNSIKHCLNQILQEFSHHLGFIDFLSLVLRVIPAVTPLIYLAQRRDKETDLDFSLGSMGQFQDRCLIRQLCNSIRTSTCFFFNLN